MSGQPQLFPNPEPTVEDAAVNKVEPVKRTAPVWLQRLSLFVLVLFCVYLGVLVMVLPWWTRMSSSWRGRGLQRCCIMARCGG